MAERGVTVTYEAIRAWCYKFGQDYAKRIRARRGQLGDTWHLDEVYVKIDGRLQYLWRAVDQDGSVLDILVQPHRDKKAAARFFRKLLRSSRYAPRVVVTDRLARYIAPCAEWGAQHRASTRQGIEQPGREFSSVDTRAREADARV